MSGQDLMAAFEQLQREATRLAGEKQDLAQRAAVYHHLFEHSQSNFTFPLIAAHGALWARDYFRFGLGLGVRLVWLSAFTPAAREARLEQLAAFADAFREVNRRVCVDTYTVYHFTARYGHLPEAAKFVAPRLLTALNDLHAARAREEELPDEAKREIFTAFFLNEQQTVVGPRVTQAADLLQWPLMKFLALRPLVRFAYFPGRRRLWFRSFLNQQERIQHGHTAFDLGAQVGWHEVAARLADYQILPAAFFTNSQAHFQTLRQATWAGAC